MLPAIEVKQVCKRYGDLCVLTDIDLEVHTGEFFALLGPNGAGKTTLISIIAGLSLANSGSVNVMGHHVTTHYQQARLNLGIVPQELVFDPFFTVRETLLIQSGYYGIKANTRWVDEIIERLDLTDKADVNMRALSGGMKRRVLVAQALVHKPPVIILDEPTVGLDPTQIRETRSLIRELAQDHTVILSSHILPEVEATCKRIVIINKGRIVASGTIDELRQRITGESRLSGISDVKAETNNGWVRVSTATQGDQREPLAQLVSKRGWGLRELRRDIPTLEDFFVKIVAQARSKQDD